MGDAQKMTTISEHRMSTEVVVGGFGWIRDPDQVSLVPYVIGCAWTDGQESRVGSVRRKPLSSERRRTRKKRRERRQAQSLREWNEGARANNDDRSRREALGKEEA